MIEEENAGITSLLLNQSKAIRICLDQRLTLPALMLIYACIDFCASLIRPENQSDVKGADFIAWADLYMRPSATLGVTATDLYAARCGVLHTSSAESRLWREGKANRIFYTWGDKSADSANDLLAQLGKTERFVHVETLFETLINGAVEFISHLNRDKKLKTVALSRAISTLANVSELPLPPELSNPIE